MLSRPMPIDTVVVNPVRRTPEINPVRSQAQYWVQGTQAQSRVSMTGSGTAQDSIYCEAQKGLSGDFEIVGFTTRQNAAYRVIFQINGGYDKQLSNNFVHIDFVAGVGEKPTYMPVSFLLEARTALTIRYQNISSSVDPLAELVAHGRRFLEYVNEEQRRQMLASVFSRREWPFWLVLNDTSVTLTANQENVTRKMNVPSDGDFEVEYLLAKSTGPFLLALSDQNGQPVTFGGGSDQQDGVANLHITGTAIEPYRMPLAAFWPRQTILNATFTNLINASNTIEICLFGRLLDYPAGQGRPPVPQSPSESIQFLTQMAANPLPQQPFSPPRQAVPVQGGGVVPALFPKWARG